LPRAAHQGKKKRCGRRWPMRQGRGDATDWGGGDGDECPSSRLRARLCFPGSFSGCFEVVVCCFEALIELVAAAVVRMVDVGAHDTSLLAACCFGACTIMYLGTVLCLSPGPFDFGVAGVVLLLTLLALLRYGAMRCGALRCVAARVRSYTSKHPGMDVSVAYVCCTAAPIAVAVPSC
jgi:hypothetical protein